jgi:hypothetical protein
MAKALNNRRSGHDESKLTAHWTRSKPAPKVATAAPPSISIQGRRVLAIFTDYNGLQKAIASRREELQITMEELDFLSRKSQRLQFKIINAN